MRKTYKMEDLDCANCAAKMEEGIRKIEGVEYVSISYMAQKMVIEAPEEQLDAIMKQAQKVCKKVDSDCTILL